MPGTHAETLIWLEGQLSEFTKWKQDILLAAPEEQRGRFEKIAAHCDWLSSQIEALSTSPSTREQRV